MMDFTNLSLFTLGFSEKHSVPDYECTVCRDHGEILHLRHGVCERAERGFWLYSATKVFTSAAAMQMIERGILDPSAPVRAYLPEFAVRKGLCVWHLLSMQGGYNYEFPGEVSRYIAAHPLADTREIIAQFAAVEPDFEPGTHFAYSWCLDILGAVMEAASGVRLGQWMQENIFDPLGMENTTFHPNAKAMEKLCPQYNMRPDGSVRRTGNGNFCRLTENFESAGGGLYTIAADVSLFADALACDGVGKNGKAILRPESVKRMETNLLTGEALDDFHRRYQRPGYGYGHGVRVCISDDNPEPRGTFGWDGAAGAHVLIDRKNRVSMVYLQHVLNMEFIYDGVFPQMDGALYEGLPLKKERI